MDNPRNALCNALEVSALNFIQSFGVLLVLDKELKILQASENIKTLCGIEAHLLLGEAVEILPIKGLYKDLLDIISYKNGQGSDLFVHVNSEYGFELHFQDEESFIILQYIPLPESLMNFQEISGQVFNLANELAAIDSFPNLCQTFVKKVKKILGFDKVLIYQFLEDFNGKVIAEANEKGMEEYLGNHFPQSDVPMQVRRLFLKNPLRVIYDCHQEPVPLIPPINPLTGKATDLSFSILKGVVPVHREYVNNMHIRTSISYAIRVRGELWGLISCHHREPKLFTHNKYLSLAHCASLLSNACLSHYYDELNISEEHYETLSKAIKTLTEKEEDIHDSFMKHGATLLQIANASGAALHFEGKLSILGKTPSNEQIKQIVSWLDTNRPREFFHTDALSTLMPDASAFKKTASGVIAAPLGPEPSNVCLWFRPEHPFSIKWAGKPHEVSEENGIRPRNSFKVWQEEIAGKSQKWLPREIKAISLLNKEINQGYVTLYHTKKLLAEASLHEIQFAANKASEGIFTLNDSGCVEWMNRRSLDLLGIPELTDAKMPLIALLEGRTQSDLQPLEEALATKSSYTGEISLGEKTILMTLTPYRRMEDSAMNMIGISTDISELKNRVEELNALLKVKDKFIRMAAHDIRNPISSIIMATSLIEQKLEKGEIGDLQKIFAMISAQAQGTLDLLNNILNENLIKSGQFKIQPEDVEIASFVRETCELHKLVASKKGISIEYTQEIDRPHCRFDKIKIKQVLDNFLSNAIKASAPDMTVQLHCSLKGNHLQFEVSDEGPGIPKELQETLFDQQPKMVSKETHGLGLAICREIVRAHGGEIGFKNLKRGARFYLKITV